MTPLLSRNQQEGRLNKVLYFRSKIFYMPSNSFLNQIARRYIELSRDGNAVSLVFPNRRAALFFRKELLELQPKDQWMPEIFSAEEFVASQMQTSPINQISALFEFYGIYQATEGEKADPFDVFLTWAPQLLHDFEEVDLYMVDAKDLYALVSEAYALQRWSPDNHTITPIQSAYLHFWSMMGTWYSLFRQHLRDKRMLTTGMAYRAFADSIETKGTELEWHKVLFCGFSALNGAEQRIIKFLQKIGKAEVLWDVDTYYVEDELNEAGHFFRKYKNDWAAHTFKNMPSRLDRAEQKFEIIGASKNLGQAIEAGALLAGLADEGCTFEDTAVVLGDERLMLPMLELLPQAVPAVNVTMSYPLQQLPVMGLYTAVFELQRRCRSNDDNSKPVFYFKDLLKIFRQSNIRQILGDEYCKMFIKKINASSYKYLNILSWEESVLLNDKLGFLFKPWKQSVSEAITCLIRFSQAVFDESARNEVERDYTADALSQTKLLLNQIEIYNARYPGILNLASLQRVFSQLIRQISLSFYGEPLKGLQLMGLLETRNVEFKNLIVLSVNEGILPATRSHRSFIPFDIALGFELPTYRDRDALFAYHFYRMIQGAERVWLIYNTESDEFGKGEQSRFITQLEQELMNAKHSHSIRVPELPKHFHSTVRVAKSPELLQRMRERYHPANPKGLSASALKKFINCELSFYLSYFSNVAVEEDREEDVEANEIGTICHAVLQNLYKPFIGQILKEKDLVQMRQLMPEELSLQFRNTYGPESISQGKHVLAHETACNMLLRYLNWELNCIKEEKQQGVLTTIKALEVNLDTVLTIQTAQDEFEVKLFGVADRIDVNNQNIRILDYKTGSVDKDNLKFKEMDEIFSNPDLEKAMQLFFYQLLYSDKYPENTILSGIIPLKSPSKNILFVKQPGEADAYEQIKTGFTELIEKMFNEELAFEQTEDPDRCKYCNFTGLCNRV